MGRLRKFFINNTLIEICFRTEEGLPLAANPYMKTILESILARASEYYPLQVCHFVVMANHLHILGVVGDPEKVDDFVAYIKRESSHAINSLLGRDKHTIWCAGYDSPTILDPEKVIERMVYLYTNPQEANLVDKIEDYPNLNTWSYFRAGGGQITAPRIPRFAIPKLPGRSLSFSEQHRLKEQLLDYKCGEYCLVIEPDAWIGCFADLSDEDIESVNEEIIRRVREVEERLRKGRKTNVLGAHALRLQPINAGHLPKKRGKRMICMARSKRRRSTFIQWFKDCAEQAGECFRKLRIGEDRVVFPPGFFAPGAVYHSSVSPILRADLLQA